LVEVLVVAGEVKRHGVIYIEVHAPATAVGADVGLAANGRHERHGFAVGVAARRRDVLFRVGKHFFDIAHQRVHVAENRVVDALKNVLSAVGFDEVSVVDMPVAVGLNGLYGFLNVETADYFLKFLFVHKKLLGAASVVFPSRDNVFIISKPRRKRKRFTVLEYKNQ